MRMCTSLTTTTAVRRRLPSRFEYCTYKQSLNTIFLLFLCKLKVRVVTSPKTIPISNVMKCVNYMMKLGLIEEPALSISSSRNETCKGKIRKIKHIKQSK